MYNKQVIKLIYECYWTIYIAYESESMGNVKTEVKKLIDLLLMS